jgi:hypothetical protein
MIDDELMAFVEEGQSIHVSTRDGEGRPVGVRGVAVRVDGDREHVDVYIADVAYDRLRAPVETSRKVAIVLGRPRDDRSCQLKGTLVAVRQAEPAERTIAHAQWDAFMAALDGIGISRRLAERWTWWPARIIKVKVTAVFEQTPGPKAGVQLV